ncbi:MAG: fused DSP-PTPase phosphatase/NAD kinase-like protein [Gemmataceae bacterium]
MLYCRFLGILVLIIVIVAPTYVSKYQQKQYRNFKVVKKGVLYRSGQMTSFGLKKIVDEYHIKSIVSLRDSYGSEAPPDVKEESFAREYGIKYLRLSPKKWESEDGEPPVMDNVRQYFKLLDNPDNYPVLVHCFAGIHRTGSYCALYRMKYENWSNEKAISELKRLGYDQLETEKDVYKFLKEYKADSK